MKSRANEGGKAEPASHTGKTVVRVSDITVLYLQASGALMFQSRAGQLRCTTDTHLLDFSVATTVHQL